MKIAIWKQKKFLNSYDECVRHIKVIEEALGKLLRDPLSSAFWNEASSQEGTAWPSRHAERIHNIYEHNGAPLSILYSKDVSITDALGYLRECSELPVEKVMDTLLSVAWSYSKNRCRFDPKADSSEMDPEKHFLPKVNLEAVEDLWLIEGCEFKINELSFYNIRTSSSEFLETCLNSSDAKFLVFGSLICLRRCRIPECSDYINMGSYFNKGAATLFCIMNRFPSQKSQENAVKGYLRKISDTSSRGEKMATRSVLGKNISAYARGYIWGRCREISINPQLLEVRGGDPFLL